MLYRCTAVTQVVRFSRWPGLLRCAYGLHYPTCYVMPVHLRDQFQDKRSWFYREGLCRFVLFAYP